MAEESFSLVAAVELDYWLPSPARRSPPSDMSEAEDQNPFASPQSALAEEAFDGDPIWHEDQLLIATLPVDLPSRCLKCGKPGQARHSIGLVSVKPTRRYVKWWQALLAFMMASVFFRALVLNLDRLSEPVWESVFPIFPLAIVGIMQGYEHFQERRRIARSGLHYSLCPHHERLHMAHRAVGVSFWLIMMILMGSMPILRQWIEIDRFILIYPFLAIVVFAAVIQWLFSSGAVECRIVHEKATGHHAISGASAAFLDSLPNYDGAASAKQKSRP